MNDSPEMEPFKSPQLCQIGVKDLMQQFLSLNQLAVFSRTLSNINIGVIKKLVTLVSLTVSFLLRLHCCLLCFHRYDERHHCDHKEHSKNKREHTSAIQISPALMFDSFDFTAACLLALVKETDCFTKRRTVSPGPRFVRIGLGPPVEGQ